MTQFVIKNKATGKYAAHSRGVWVSDINQAKVLTKRGVKRYSTAYFEVDYDKGVHEWMDIDPKDVVHVPVTINEVK